MSRLAVRLRGREPLGRRGRYEFGPGDHAHRDLRSGGLRAAIFGVSDGLVTSVSLVLGTAAAQPGPGVVRLAGLAGLLGGSFSMAAGEYVSMAAQRETFERELAIERRELVERPEGERNELRRIYERRGVAPGTAAHLVDQLMADPEVALETHAREELGIDPHSLGSPIQAAVSSFAAFAIGAFIPLAPFLNGTSHHAQVILAIALTVVTAICVGAVLSLFTMRPVLVSAFRSLAFCVVAGAVTFGIGSAIGISAH